MSPLAALLLLGLITTGDAQYFDIFQGFQPFLQSQTTQRPKPQKKQQIEFVYSPQDGDTNNRFIVINPGNTDNVATEKNQHSYKYEAHFDDSIRTTKSYTTSTAKPPKRNSSQNNKPGGTRHRNSNKQSSVASIVSNSDSAKGSYNDNENRRKQSTTEDSYYAIRPLFKPTTKAPIFDSYDNDNYYENVNYNKKPSNSGRPNNNAHTTAKPTSSNVRTIYTTAKPNKNIQRLDSNRPNQSEYSSYTTKKPNNNNDRNDNSNYYDQSGYSVYTKPNNQRTENNYNRPSQTDYNSYTTTTKRSVRPEYNNDRPNQYEYSGYTTTKPNKNNQRTEYYGERPSQSEYNSYTTKTPNYNHKPEYNNDRPSQSDYSTYVTTKPTKNNQRPEYNNERPSQSEYNSYTTKPNRPQRPDYNGDTYSSYSTSRPNYENTHYTTTNKPNYYNYEGSYNDRPSYNAYTTHKNTNKRPSNSYTTQNPYTHRPGVKPAVIHGPPITNRPIHKPYTEKPAGDFGNEDAVYFPEEKNPSPEVVIGPDVDVMSATQRRKYVDLAEKLCDKYKSFDSTLVAAIPLLPEPEPVTFNVSGCAPRTAPLIVGGKVVNIDQFPHNAALGWLKLEGAGYSWKCGGSLISDRFVLTAAHCAYQERDNTVVAGSPRVVQLGSSYLDDPGALVVRVSKSIRHPRYKIPRSYYDVALLKLVTSVRFSEVIKPACIGLPPAAGESIIATGWGRTEFGGESSEELRGVSIPVWDMATCSRVLGPSRKLPQGPSADSQLCAGEVEGGKDTCQGDSGGPAQVLDGCAWRVVGVTSVGRACGAPRTPALYATVLREFVAAVITMY
ncbi:hypothetical protein JYU34_007925 [Plutella xylostella]|uniref:Peptidase S1 domain-containing protein n=1 Tax=Plutella xylostella TaxID=51655 RepID=A0ABQ7QNF0_PLUXY|nr:hypothetical protein JYU34_007925 [Plutella xylostella]